MVNFWLRAYLGIFMLSNLIELLLCKASKVLEPRAGTLIITADYRDRYVWSCQELFGFLPMLDEKMFFKVTSTQMTPLTGDEYPDFKIPEQPGMNRPLLVEINSFGKVPSAKFGQFISVCLFAWVADEGEPDPIFDEKGCLKLHFRVVNNSLDYTNLTAFTYGKNLSVTAAEGATSIRFDTLTQGLLPNFLNYSLTCKPVSENTTVDPPKMVSDESAIKTELINWNDFNGFVGANQTYLDGYIIDYDLEQNFFRLHRADVSMKLLKGIQATNRCSEATFFSKVEDEIISLYVLCSSDTSIELIQLKVETVLMQLYKSSESGWKKMIYIERTVVMEKGTACQSFMEQNTVSCVSNHLSTVEENKILVYRLHTEPLRLTVIQKIPFVVFTQNRWLKEYAIESFQYVKAGTPRLLSFTAKLANQSRLLIDFVLNIQYFIDPTTTIVTMPIILDITGTDMDPSDELRFCSTALGRFYFDRVQNNVRILGVDTRTMYNSYAEAAVSNSAI